MADTILNMRAFLLTADRGSFSAAARELGVAPSVITKRVRQLEWALRAPLLNRSTRIVHLTEVGERYLLAIRQMVREYDDIVSGVPRSAQEIEGHIRIQASHTQAMIELLSSVWSFQRKHPRITLDVAMMDRMANPIEEGYDIVFGVAPGSYDGVLEEPLMVVPRVLCASPEYLARRGSPLHPQQIPDHDCIVFSIVDPAWVFNGPVGPISVGLRPHIITNSNVIIFNAACAGAGLAILSRLQAAAVLETGELVEVLPDFPVSDLWLKAFIPETRSRLARVQALLADVRAAAVSEPALL